MPVAGSSSVENERGVAEICFSMPWEVVVGQARPVELFRWE